MKIADYYKIYYKANEYLFLPLTRHPIEIMQLNKLINNDNNYDSIILNINNQLITNINGKQYILTKISNKNKNYNIYNELLKSKIVLTKNENIDKIIKTNWNIIWSEKIDYIEYQISNLDVDNLLSKSAFYYIGMAENAISYVNEVLMNSYNHNLYISHRRVNFKYLNNPLNLIVDYRSRDIAEYLKYLFIEKKYDYIEIENNLKKLDLDEFLCKMIYARMFFVTFYFDIFDAAINNYENNEIILKRIISRADEYEDYINNIYNILFQIKKIPKIDWV